MATIVQLNARQWAQRMARRAEEIMPAMRQALRAGAMRAIPVLHDASRAANAVDTGQYLRAWKTRPTESGVAIVNDAPYAAIIELGRRPGAKMPPVQAIQTWAQRRLGLSRKQAENAAWAIAKSISIKGIKARRVLRNALPQLKKLMKGEVRRELARFFQGSK